MVNRARILNADLTWHAVFMEATATEIKKKGTNLWADPVLDPLLIQYRLKIASAWWTFQNAEAMYPVRELHIRWWAGGCGEAYELAGSDSTG